MMVRDEAENLPRCLESIKDFVDEIIVVDTGSKDNTVEIAKSFGAKVYHHPWENNFSTHRNQSISYATGDWLLIIDADEELHFHPQSSIETSRKWIGVLGGEHKAIAINLHDIQNGRKFMQLNTSRFFRNGAVEYTGRVHNQPNNIKAVFCEHLFLHHYGYDLTPEQKEAKRVRTNNLLLQDIEENPTNYNSLFYLAQNHLDHQAWEEAAKYSELYIEHREELEQSGNFYEAIYFTAIRAYMRIGDRVKAEEWLTAGVEKLPHDLDIAIAFTEYGVWMEKPDLIVRGAKKFLTLYEPYETDPMLREPNHFVYTILP
jgi:glycosyltransferase involved in cell wall biosynthesis